MSSQVSITQLPQAQALTGTESVPIVQGGVTVQTTTGAISGAGALNYPFLTVGSTAGLTQARYIATGSGLSLTDNGAGGTLQINLTGAAQSLDSSGTGIQVKTGSNTVTARSIAVGAGLGITNADGVSGDPTVALGTFLQQFVSLTGTGMLAIQSGSVGKVNILGTTNQISITNGDGAADVTIALSSNPVIPGNGSITVPNGTTGQRVTNLGSFRYNTSLQQFEGYTNTGWNQFSLTGGVTSFSAGTTGFTPNTATTGAVTLDGTLNVSNGGTGATTLTGYVKGNGSLAMTASASVPTTDLSGTVTNAQLSNSSITINGSSVSLGGSITVTATASNALTIGAGLSGTSYNGSTPVTIAIDSTVATLTGSQTLTNKSISGSTNTLSNIANASLTNSSLTIGTTAISLGGTSLTLGGLTSVTVTQDPTSALQLATKQYVDSVAQGLNVKTAVAWGTTANITLSGLGTQAGGEWTGTLTASDRILVKNQSTAANNGIYSAASGAWTRTADADTWNELVSAFVFVQQGATLGDTGWVCTVDPGGTLGVTAVTWVQFSGAGTYTAGTGLTLTGTQFSITNTAVSAASYGSGSQVGTFTVNAQGQLTSASNTTIAISNTQVSGLGTMSTQNANSVSITGGAIDGTTIGATTASTVKATTLTTTGTGSPTDGTGQVFLNGATSNRVEWAATGTGAPAFTTRSAGTKLLLYPAISGSQVDYAIGINSATLWSSIPVASSSFFFKWYGGQTEVASMDGTGAFTATSFAGAGTGLTGTASSLSIGGNAATATSTAITANSTNATNYLTFVSATTGNLPQLVNSSITCNPSTGQMTGGIAGGAF